MATTIQDIIEMLQGALLQISPRRGAATFPEMGPQFSEWLRAIHLRNAIHDGEVILAAMPPQPGWHERAMTDAEHWFRVRATGLLEQ